MTTDTQPITRAELREELERYATAAELAQVKTIVETIHAQINRRFDSLEAKVDLLVELIQKQ